MWRTLRLRRPAVALGTAVAAATLTVHRGADPVACSPLPPETPRRDLRTLPKAHLHIHFGGAVVRRETLEELANLPGWHKQRKKAISQAQDQAKAARHQGQDLHAQKYQRRADLLSKKNVIDAGFGPPPPARDASEDEILKSLRHIDTMMMQPGAGIIWDAQWIAGTTRFALFLRISPLFSFLSFFFFLSSFLFLHFSLGGGACFASDFLTFLGANFRWNTAEQGT